MRAQPSDRGHIPLGPSTIVYRKDRRLNNCSAVLPLAIYSRCVALLLLLVLVLLLVCFVDKGKRVDLLALPPC